MLSATRFPTMPLPLFMPCAAGVEGFLADEVRRLLPSVRVDQVRGGVALCGALTIGVLIKLP